MNLRDNSIGNIEKIIAGFVDEKISNKKKKDIASMMSAIAINAFRLGFQAALKQEITEAQFNNMLYSKDDGGKLGAELGDILFRITV